MLLEIFAWHYNRAVWSRTDNYTKYWRTLQCNLMVWHHLHMYNVHAYMYVNWYMSKKLQGKSNEWNQCNSSPIYNVIYMQYSDINIGNHITQYAQLCVAHTHCTMNKLYAHKCITYMYILHKHENKPAQTFEFAGGSGKMAIRNLSNTL